MSTSDFIQTLRANLNTQQHRHCVVICGDWKWRIEQLAHHEKNSGFWVGEPSPLANLAPLQPSQIRHHLGQEIPTAVFCAEQGIDADALGIISGMVQAGGILWILIPPLNAWLKLPNPANQRFLNHPQSYLEVNQGFTRFLYASLKTHALWLEQGQNLPKLSSNQMPFQHKLQGLTPDQQHGLDAILHCGFGHPKRPLLLEADRGRGKTSLLGIAAIELLLQGKNHIVITASRLSQVATAFEQAALSLEARKIPYQQQPGLLMFETKTLEFRAPDSLIGSPQTLSHKAFDLLMIDEAAQLALPLLQSLVLAHSRVVMATTQHGYEGSGRGFGLRFKPFLDQTFQHWQSRCLQQPIRWHHNDPLEILINRMLLLDAELDGVESGSNTELIIRRLAIAKLTPVELKPIFALLVQAHYQTSPADLQQLLSSNDLNLYIGYQNQRCVAVLLVTREGGIPSPARHRRVKGHLVPQKLQQTYGDLDLMSKHSERVMRLAVHPNLQRQGIGRKMVEAWLNQTQAEFASVSFGVTADLFHFWKQLGFQSTHLGAKRDKASGTHNLIMLKSLNSTVEFGKLFKLYQQQLPHSLMEFITGLEPGLVIELLAENTPDSQQIFDFQHYLEGTQAYEAISHQLWHWTVCHADSMRRWPQPLQAIWLDKILRKQPWQQLADTYRLAGRKGVEDLLKQALNQI
ncbi:tRNA(Met) cytidine acetyltransferase [Thiomicrospira microaerophila]|uniref:GNAT family N-acetyltransferase n=1 Tax=Thiomicrospira microaerophila TaxID=406020 RepID=UPI00201037F1|nr:GNAT family N-acetyltransferase [Thiomicrospira microaerophila]UQB42094.1 tRNA(Met) cytidine acetyltransferase [Thiomicrospira microaerophila]